MERSAQQEFDFVIEKLQWDYSLQTWEQQVPVLLAISKDDIEANAKLRCMAARYYFLIGNQSLAMEMISPLRQLAQLPSKAKARVALVEAYMLCAADEYNKASERLAFAIALIDHIDSALLAFACAVRGRNRGMEGDYVSAIVDSQEAIALNPPEPWLTAYANMTLSYVFQAMGRFSESEHYANEQLQFYLKVGWRPGISGTYSFLAIGAVLEGDGAKAKQFRDAAVAALPGNHAMSPTSIPWMAAIQISLDEYPEALQNAEEFVRSAETANDPVRLANAWILLGQVRLNLGEHGAALALFEAASQREEVLSEQQRMSLYRSIVRALREVGRIGESAEPCWKLWQLQSDFDRRATTAILDYQKRLEQKIHEQQTALLQAKATHLERELSIQAISMAAQTELLATFRDDLRRVVREIADPMNALKQVKEKLKALPCEQIDWAKFEAQFTSVHPEFRTALIAKYPDLTNREIKMCQLARLGLKTFEMARLLCVSERTVDWHRSSLRKKMGLKSDQNLGEFLQVMLVN